MEREEQKILEVCQRFALEGKYLRYEVLNSGHINSTYRVYFFRGGEEKDYIIQKVNTYVFTEPEKVMENISAVTEFIRAKIKATGVTAKRSVLHYSKTEHDEYHTTMPDGGFWRCCRFIDGSVSFTQTDDLKIIEESGKAFGEFQNYLAQFDASKLTETIARFHDTPNRFANFKAALEKDEFNRAKDCQKEIEFVLSHENTYGIAMQGLKDGSLPLRVTHNDTKLNNILMDDKTGKARAVIDLDTIMPGSMLFDFGDSIRFGASTAAEDEKDLSKVHFDINLFKAYAEGYCGAVKDSITKREAELLPYGSYLMTIECGMRFLTDYLSGDTYFATKYEGHNLVRCRTQIQLAAEMEAQFEQMSAIIKEILK